MRSRMMRILAIAAASGLIGGASDPQPPSPQVPAAPVVRAPAAPAVPVPAAAVPDVPKPPAPPVPPPKPPAAPPAHTEQMLPDRASGILDAAVHGPDGNKLGTIVDVLVDGTGRPRAAVVDFGGILGMGSRKVAVSWTNLHFSPTAATGMTIKLDLTADQIKAAPAYQDAKPASVVVAKPPAK